MPIANTNDGTVSQPALRCYFNLLAFDDIPALPSDPPARLAAIREAGYEGVQFIAPITPAERSACERLGLGRASSGRVNVSAEAYRIAEIMAGEGMECGTLHVGWGIEDDDEAHRLIQAVVDASERYGMPLYVETHRATIFQDPWRTVQFVKRFPQLRFNGDFSHWYTGSELVYGGVDRKIAFVAPVIERVRFLHGRIGNPGCMQVDIGDGDPIAHPYVAHFRALWTACFHAFLSSAAAGDYIVFAPELLSWRIYYARAFPQGESYVEEGNRWAQSLVLRRIAQDCFKAAAVNATMGSA